MLASGGGGGRAAAAGRGGGGGKHGAATSTLTKNARDSREGGHDGEIGRVGNQREGGRGKIAGTDPGISEHSGNPGSSRNTVKSGNPGSSGNASLSLAAGSAERVAGGAGSDEGFKLHQEQPPQQQHHQEGLLSRVKGMQDRAGRTQVGDFKYCMSLYDRGHIDYRC